MPGKRGAGGVGEKSVTIQLRVTQDEAMAWKEHTEKHGGYVSVLIRESVQEHLERHRQDRRCGHWG